ncbi:MAG: KEOPS complex subunit Cgi121, partial [Euryarchaeota archaeon]|nr:KEOPS complex subunit Cgi121 [Euryarchaeota archaeon]
MIKKILEDYVGIFGLVNLAPIDVEELTKKVKELAKKTQTAIQVFDPAVIAGFDHVFRAAYLALKSFKQKTNISTDLAVELLIYVSGRKQIQEAIKLFGVKQNSLQIVVVMISDSQKKIENSVAELLKLTNASIDDGIINSISKEKFERLKKLFKITQIELEAIKAAEWPTAFDTFKQLILERV